MDSNNKSSENVLESIRTSNSNNGINGDHCSFAQTVETTHIMFDEADDSDDDVIFISEHRETNNTAASNTIGWTCPRKPCISTIHQFALYKCVHEMCFFATNSEDNFREHMEKHDEINEYEKEKGTLVKTEHDQMATYRHCAYCRVGI